MAKKVPATVVAGRGFKGNQTHAVLGRVILGRWVPMSGMTTRSIAVLFKHSTFHRWAAQSAARMLLSDKPLSCCAAGTNGCLDLRRRAFARGEQMSPVCSRCSGSMARRAGDSVAPLRRSSARYMSARMLRFSAGLRCRRPVTRATIQ